MVHFTRFWGGDALSLSMEFGISDAHQIKDTRLSDILQAPNLDAEGADSETPKASRGVSNGEGVSPSRAD